MSNVNALDIYICFELNLSYAFLIYHLYKFLYIYHLHKFIQYKIALYYLLMCLFFSSLKFNFFFKFI